MGGLTTAHAWCNDKVLRDFWVPRSRRQLLSTPAEEGLELCTSKRRDPMETIRYRCEVGEFVMTSKQVTALVGEPADLCIGFNALI